MTAHFSQTQAEWGETVVRDKSQKYLPTLGQTGFMICNTVGRFASAI